MYELREWAAYVAAVHCDLIHRNTQELLEVVHAVSLASNCRLNGSNEQCACSVWFAL